MNMNFSTYRVFANDDADFYGDTLYTVLVDDGSKTIVLWGDYYHDKIDQKIEGFFHCMGYLSMPYSHHSKNISESDFNAKNIKR